jgi:hypothetical protein
MLDLLHSREILFAPRRRNARVLVRHLEVVGVGVPEVGLVTRLAGQPLKEPFAVREGGVQRGLS